MDSRVMLSFRDEVVKISQLQGSPMVRPNIGFGVKSTNKMKMMGVETMVPKLPTSGNLTPSTPHSTSATLGKSVK